MRIAPKGRPSRLRRTRAQAPIALCALVLLVTVMTALPAGARAQTPSVGAGLDVGVFHSCALLPGESVRCWGYSGDGQVGYGDRNTIGDDETPGSVGPVNVGAGRTVKAIAAGDYHTCAILDNGSVRCWGFAFEGQLGYGDRNQIGDNEAPGTVGPVKLGTGRTATAISAGGRHTCAVLDDGSVRCWGGNADGQLGYGNTTFIGDTETPDSVGPVNLGAGRKAVAISVGGRHTCAVLDDGSVRCWGTGGNGELGYGNTSAVDDPSLVGPVNLGPGRTAVAIGAGDSHTCALLDNGSVRCWGLGEMGQLGYGNTNNVGDNETPGSAGPVNLGSGRTAVAVSAGGAHTCAVLDDRSIRCWGSSETGQLGYGNTNKIGDNETPGSVGPVDVGTGRTVVAVGAGLAHTCARLDDGSVRCWGLAFPGRLGYCNNDNIGDDEAPGSAGPVDLGVPGLKVQGCPMAPTPSPTPTPAPTEAPSQTPDPSASPTATADPSPLPDEPDRLKAALAAQRARAAALRACLRKIGKPAKRGRPSAKRRKARRRAALRRKACLKRHGRTPGRVTRLAARTTGKRKIRLSFRVAGTNGSKAPAARSYLIKQSRRRIRSDRGFARAHSLCKGRCSFKVTRLGATIKLNVTDLRRRRVYRYAVKARDNVSGRTGPRSATIKIRTR